MPRILFNVNIPRFFVSHRLSLAAAAADAGYEVHVATAAQDRESIADIVAAGFRHHALPLVQHGINPVNELQAITGMVRLYRRLKPSLVHHVTIKPVIYGGIAARLCEVDAVVSALSGLGYVFDSDDSRARLIRQFAKPLFRIAFGHPRTKVIFQNPDDLRVFRDTGLLGVDQGVLIRGSGVDPDRFVETPERSGTPVVLFAGRLMRKKGLRTFAQAAHRLRKKARFVVVGYSEASSPDGVPMADLEQLAKEGVLEFWGKRNDMPDVYAASHVVCLPSTYGEGVPKVLIEAASCGRPLVSFDTAGCREIVRHDETGILVPPGDLEGLVSALGRLIDDDALRRRLGMRGREIVLRDFTLDRVIRETLGLYASLLGEKTPRAFTRPR